MGVGGWVVAQGPSQECPHGGHLHLERFTSQPASRSIPSALQHATGAPHMAVRHPKQAAGQLGRVGKEGAGRPAAPEGNY